MGLYTHGLNILQQLLYKKGVFIDNSFATGLISNFLFCNHIISLCSFSALCSFHFFFLPPLLDQHYFTKIKKNRGIHNNSKNLKGAEMQIGERKVLTWRCVLHYKHTECPQRRAWCARHAVVGPESKKHCTPEGPRQGMAANGAP